VFVFRDYLSKVNVKCRSPYLPYVQRKSLFEVNRYWNGFGLGRIGKRYAERMSVLQKGRATGDSSSFV